MIVNLYFSGYCGVPAISGAPILHFVLNSSGNNIAGTAHITSGVAPALPNQDISKIKGYVQGSNVTHVGTTYRIEFGGVWVNGKVNTPFSATLALFVDWHGVAQIGTGSWTLGSQGATDSPVHFTTYI